MALIPKEVIEGLYRKEVRKSAFIVYCLLCQNKQDTGRSDATLSQSDAHAAGIERAAYFAALAELQKRQWITLIEKREGQRYWNLIKGFAV